MDTMKFAGLWPRVWAFLLDYLIILSYIGLITGLTLMIKPIQSLYQNPIQADVAAFLMLILPVMLYFALQESSSQQSTWGKRRIKLKVVHVDGTRLTIGRAVIRSLIKFLPWQLAHTAIYHSVQESILPQPMISILYLLAYGLTISYVLLIWKHPKHRSIYDWVARSTVIRM